jgi:2-polyprenyl-3-methyl-5-hydroxy-6-metoxy-1,4-benzoquinol methylase
MASQPQSSLTHAYAGRLESRAVSRWRKYFGVQLPYRWNIRRLNPGFVLDVGCGVGRNLAHLDGHGVGVDPNPDCVEAAKHRGLRAYLPKDFERAAATEAWQFDTMLVAHVLEHVGLEASVPLVRGYLRYLTPGGRVVLIAPQEAGYRSDSTHLEFIDEGKLRRLCNAVDLRVERAYSFPFPRFVGGLFAYNEFVLVAATP